MALFDNIRNRFRRRKADDDAGDDAVVADASAVTPDDGAGDFPGNFSTDFPSDFPIDAADPAPAPPFDAADPDAIPAAAPSAPLSVADFDFAPAELADADAPTRPPSDRRAAPPPAAADPVRDDLAADLAAAQYQERLLSPPGALSPPARDRERAPEPSFAGAATAPPVDRSVADDAGIGAEIGAEFDAPPPPATNGARAAAGVAADSHLVMDCPYCGMPEQHIGSRCDKCQQVIIRLPSWAQRRRQNWFTRRLSFRRILSAVVLALLIVFVIWINYPFAPNPLILFKNVQSQLTIDSGPGNWTVSGQNLQHNRYVQEGPPPPQGIIEWQHREVANPLAAEAVGERANIYIGSADGIFPLNLRDQGHKREGWEGETDGRITAAPALIDTYLYFGSTDHTVNSWDAFTGESRWTFKAADTVDTAPIVAQGLLYISSGKGWIYALDAVSGDEIWSAQLSNNASAAPALYEGRLLVGDDKGIVYILSARTGQEFSRYRTPRGVTGSPVISADGEHAYFAAGGDLYAISARRREIPGLYQFKQVWAQLWIWQVPGVPRPPGQQGGLWRFGPENPLLGIKSSPALADGILYAGGHDHNLYAIDAATGKLAWEEPFQAAGAIWASPLVVKDRVIFGDVVDGAEGFPSLYALDRDDGELLWRITLDGNVRIAPTLINGKLIVRTDDGTVYAIQ